MDATKIKGGKAYVNIWDDISRYILRMPRDRMIFGIGLIIIILLRMIIKSEERAERRAYRKELLERWLNRN